MKGLNRVTTSTILINEKTCSVWISQSNGSSICLNILVTMLCVVTPTGTLRVPRTTQSVETDIPTQEHRNENVKNIYL